MQRRFHQQIDCRIIKTTAINFKTLKIWIWWQQRCDQLLRRRNILIKLAKISKKPNRLSMKMDGLDGDTYDEMEIGEEGEDLFSAKAEGGGSGGQ
jgi:hypothetical protein